MSNLKWRWRRLIHFMDKCLSSFFLSNVVFLVCFNTNVSRAYSKSRDVFNMLLKFFSSWGIKSIVKFLSLVKWIFSIIKLQVFGTICIWFGISHQFVKQILCFIVSGLFNLTFMCIWSHLLFNWFIPFFLFHFQDASNRHIVVIFWEKRGVHSFYLSKL